MGDGRVARICVSACAPRNGPAREEQFCSLSPRPGRGGVRGRFRQAQIAAAPPHPDCFASRPLPRRRYGDIRESRPFGRAIEGTSAVIQHGTLIVWRSSTATEAFTIAACRGATRPVVSSRQQWHRCAGLAKSNAGFDSSPAPTNLSWLWANTNISWLGYYLAPAPAHCTDLSWMSYSYQTLHQQQGWNVAPLYASILGSERRSHQRDTSKSPF